MPEVFSSKRLRLKGLKYLWDQDKDHSLLRYFFSHPLKYSKNYLISLSKKSPFFQEGNLYYFGISDKNHWKKKLQSPHSKILIGLPYCIKPENCPQKKFSKDCIPENKDPCQQCLIREYQQMLNSIEHEFFIIPTLLDIAKKIILMRQQFPEKELVFIIVACPTTIVLFADLANMLQLSGIAIALSSDVCSSFSAFTAAEQGKKRKIPVIGEDFKNLFRT